MQNGMKLRSGSISARDFIDPEWQDCIFIYLDEEVQKNAQSYLEYIEKNHWTDPNPKQSHRKDCQVGDKKAVALINYDDPCRWHVDSYEFGVSGKIRKDTKPRWWTEITYLTEGAPIEIGNFIPSPDMKQTGKFSDPTKILARVYPEPGKLISFPAYFVHRILPPAHSERWTFIDFPTTMRRNGFDSKRYKEVAKRYYQS